MLNGHEVQQPDAAGSNSGSNAGTARPWLVPHRFKPGCRGNPKGSSAKLEQSRAIARELAAEVSAEAVEKLVALMRSADDERLQGWAADKLLALIGLPAKIDGDAADKGVTVVIRNFELEEAERKAAAAGRPPPASTITVRKFGAGGEVTESESGTE
jgi:hypothetical protein